ncbi:hypothetical protein [Alsobacter sp. SYSU BS001988]|jgi:hypothetical protein
MSDKPHNAGGQESELTANARKALRMKTEAGPQTRIPEHETAREGGVGARGGQVNRTDTMVGKEPTSTPNLKRSHNARTGDA